MVDRIQTSRRWWWGAAAVLASVLAFVLYAFVGTFVLGLFLYYAARPVYQRLGTRVRSPTLRATVALLVLALPAVLLFAYTVALAVGELQSLASSDLSVYEELLAPYLDVAGMTMDLQAAMETAVTEPAQLLEASSLQGLVADFATSVTASLGIAITGLLHLFVAVALAFYLLRDGENLAAWTGTHLADETMVTYGRAVDADLQTVFFGSILNALLIGTIGAIVYSMLAAVAPPEVPVPVPFLLGLLAGVGSLVPVVGMKIVYVPVALVLTGRAALADPGLLWFPLLFVVVSVVVVDTIPDIIIRPYVSGRNLHVGAVMFAYIFGPLLFGWYGIFLGPLLLVVVDDFGRVVVPRLSGVEGTAEPVSLTGERITAEPPGPEQRDGATTQGPDEAPGNGTKPGGDGGDEVPDDDVPEDDGHDEVPGAGEGSGQDGTDQAD
jgi:predicted PurR-regulated permease PerM